MAKSVYFGAGGVKKIKSIYFGAGGVKKVKKGYIGAGGVKQFFGGPEGASLTKMTSLSLTTARCSPAAATAGDTYALFAGGGIASLSNTTSVEAFNKSLTKTTAGELSSAVRGMAGASAGDYAIFFGGVTSDKYFYETGYNKYLHLYNSSLTKTATSKTGYPGMASASFNDCALFFGGFGVDITDDETYDASSVSALIYVNSSGTLTSINVSNANVCTVYRAGAASSTYAMFAGGSNLSYSGTNSTITDQVTYFDKNFTYAKTTMSEKRAWASGGCVNENIIFAGGYNNGSSSSASGTTSVDCFNSSLTRSSLTALPGTYTDYDKAVSVYGHHIINVGNYVVSYNYNLTQTVHSFTHHCGVEGLQPTTTLGNYALIHTGGIDKYIKYGGHDYSFTTEIGVFLSE